nr:hypothetical protein B0A51_14575 [Rachicladosporium sp. CCFEE 5018]
MPGRTRRVRVIALALFSFFAIVLYTRSGSTIEDYRDYAERTFEKSLGRGGTKGSGVGGGAVIPPDVGSEKQLRLEDVAATTSTFREVVVTTSTRPVAQVAPSTTMAQGLPQLEALKTTTSTVAALTTSATPSPTTSTFVGLPAITDDDSIPDERGEGKVNVDIPYDRPSSSAIHWVSMTEHFPVSSTIQLPTGKASSIPTIQHKFAKSANNGADMDRLRVIKAAAVHAWYGYREKAWGHDEIMPLSGGYKNPFNAWAATLVDALDTLWILGMEAEFQEAVDFVATIDFTTSPRNDIPLFETTIRYLGGLLAAYDISGSKHTILLDKALELGEVLYGAFDTPNRMPKTYYMWKPAFASQPKRAESRVVLAELGSLHMEFTRLAQLTGKPKFYDAVARITDELQAWQNSTRLPGMWPTLVDASGCGKPGQVDHGTTFSTPGGDGYMSTEQPVRVDIPGKVMSQAEDEVNRKFRDAQEKLAEAGDARTAGGIVGTIAKSDGSKAATYDKPESDSYSAERNGGIVGKVQVEDDASHSNSKRQLDDEPARVGTPPVKSVLHNITSDQETTRQRSGSQQSLSGADVCIPQGLGSSSRHSSEGFTLAGMSDSTYEYLPKMWLMLSGQVDQYRSMYEASMDVVRKKLLYKPMTKDNRDILFSGDLHVAVNHSSPTKETIETFKAVGSHLVCFTGGMFAMAGKLFDRPEDVEIGRKLTDGCIWAYNVTATGIMPEDFFLVKCADQKKCSWNETLYHEILDPYHVQRAQAADPNYEPDMPVLPAVPVPATPWAAIPATPTVPDLNKRQLNAADILVPAPSIASVAYDPNIREIAGTSPDKPPQTNTLPEPPYAVYTAPPPLSHAEFVAQKIEAERLPPGFKSLTSRAYILRPEAIESVFYMYRITGEQYWRDRGWEMFTAIQGVTRTTWGNSAIHDVTQVATEQVDSEESFWLAETLKYFYLLFDEPDKWSLDEWVLNTEAHFFRRTG